MVIKLFSFIQIKWGRRTIKKVIKEIKPIVPKKPNYIQNEEQNEDTIWNKTKENTAVEQTALPTMTPDELADNFDIPISQQKINKFKKWLLNPKNNYFSKQELVDQLEKVEARARYNRIS